MKTTMPSKRKKLPPLTDAERHRRFVDMAKEVEASDDPKDADRAFKRVLKPKPRTGKKKR